MLSNVANTESQGAKGNDKHLIPCCISHVTQTVESSVLILPGPMDRLATTCTQLVLCLNRRQSAPVQHYCSRGQHLLGILEHEVGGRGAMMEGGNSG